MLDALPIGPPWLWVAFAIVAAFMVAWNWPRNLLTSAIMVTSAVVGAWALMWALQLAQERPPTDKRLYLTFLFALFAAAAFLLPTAAVSVWSLLRRKPLQPRLLALSTTAVGVLLAGAWAAFLVAAPVIFLLGE
jgi:hypothetical protein